MPRGLGGKVDANGIKVRLPEDAATLLALLAVRAGRSPGEYARDVLMVHLYGVDELVKVHRDYYASLSRKRP